MGKSKLAMVSFPVRRFETACVRLRIKGMSKGAAHDASAQSILARTNTLSST